jgi:uncharacterized coiled-coil DUF342 family protein
MKKVETDNQKRKRLINEAVEMECEIQHLEYHISETLEQIKTLHPTKKELKEGLQDLMDCYYWG